MASNPLPTRRVLVVDDNRAIHDDFRKILGGNPGGGSAELLAAERLLLGEALAATPRPTFQIDTAPQGEEGVARGQQAPEGGQPSAMAFIDMRLPPGRDGPETIQRLWPVAPHAAGV